MSKVFCKVSIFLSFIITIRYLIFHRGGPWALLVCKEGFTVGSVKGGGEVRVNRKVGCYRRFTVVSRVSTRPLSLQLGGRLGNGRRQGWRTPIDKSNYWRSVGLSSRPSVFKETPKERNKVLRGSEMGRVVVGVCVCARKIITLLGRYSESKVKVRSKWK